MNTHSSEPEKTEQADYDDLTTNLVSLGTGKGAGDGQAGALPPGLVVVGLFWPDRAIFRRVEAGMTHLPNDPARGAAEIVVSPAGPDLLRVSAGVAWLDGDTGRFVVALGESLAPRTDVELWRAEAGEAGAASSAISVDGPRGFSLFGRKFTAMRAPLTEVQSLDELLSPGPEMPDALRALRRGILRRRIGRVADAPLRLVVPTSTSLNEPGVGLPPDDPALALPQFRFVFADAEEFKRVRAALEAPAPDTHDLYGEAFIILEQPAAGSEQPAEPTGNDDTQHAARSTQHDEGRVAVVGALAWRRESSGWSLLLGAVRTASANADRWLDDGAGDFRSRVLLVAAKKSGSQEQPIAIDVLSRVTDLRPDLREEGPLFPPDQEPVATLARAAAYAITSGDALRDAPADVVALVREGLKAAGNE